MSEKIRNIRRKLRNNKLNNLRLLVGRTGRRFVRHCLTNLLSAIVRTVKFLLFNPGGWAVSALLTGIVYIGNLPIPVINAEDYVSANLAEYKALNKAMDLESDRFYNDYHASVSSSTLSPILYTFWDRSAFEEQLVAAREALDESDFETLQEYTDALYEMAVSNYIGTIDTYSLRELFLDKREYEYRYLAREWSAWSTVKTLTEAKQHDEMRHYTVVIYFEHKNEDGDVEIISTVEDRWDVRDITKEEWVEDINDPRIDTKRTNGNTVNAPFPEHDDASDKFGNRFERVYYGTDNKITISIMRWVTRDKEDVYTDVATIYSPADGKDILYVTKENGTLKIDKRKIYQEYYYGPPGTVRENYLLEQYQQEYIEKMLDYYQIFHRSSTGDFIDPDMDNTEYYYRGGNEGQCVWFVLCRLHEVYGRSYHVWGHGRAIAGNLIKQYEQWEACDYPTAGGVMSGPRSSSVDPDGIPYGHVMFVVDYDAATGMVTYQDCWLSLWQTKHTYNTGHMTVQQLENRYGQLTFARYVGD